MSVARKKPGRPTVSSTAICLLQFFFEICRSQNGRLFTPIFEMCGGFGPTMNIWYKGQMALGESWWILALADGMWLANDRAFLCPLVATSRRNSQINRWMAARTPGVPSLKVRKCVLLQGFFLKFFHMVQWWTQCTPEGWLKKTMCDPTVLFS